MVDAAGRTIKLSRPEPALKANVHARLLEQRRAFQAALQSEPEPEEMLPGFDPRLGVAVGGSGRGRRRGRGVGVVVGGGDGDGGRNRRGGAFSFKAKGFYQEKAERKRAKEKLAKLQARIKSQAAKTGLLGAASLLPKPELEASAGAPVPDIEWWDAAVLPHGAADYGECILAENVATNLIEHPVPVVPSGNAQEDVVLPVMLTKAERKKMRRQRRKAVEAERQEAQRLGLAEAPAPKVRMASIMRVLGNEAIQDPTAVESVVRKQVALRQRRHEEHNAAQALTREQKREKVADKKAADAAKGLYTSVYRVGSLKSGAHKFKVRTNALQLGLTGLALMTPELTVIVVEGGAKGLKRYRKLMMQRIKWSEQAPGEEAASDEEEQEGGARAGEQGEDAREEGTAEGGRRRRANYCAMVWEGDASERVFKEFSITYCRSETFARQILARYGVGHFWDQALSEHLLGEQAARP